MKEAGHRRADLRHGRGDEPADVREEISRVMPETTPFAWFAAARRGLISRHSEAGLDGVSHVYVAVFTPGHLFATAATAVENYAALEVLLEVADAAGDERAAARGSR